MTGALFAGFRRKLSPHFVTFSVFEKVSAAHQIAQKGARDTMKLLTLDEAVVELERLKTQQEVIERSLEAPTRRGEALRVVLDTFYRSTETLAAIHANARSWHGDDKGKAAALNVIGNWAEDALDGRLHPSVALITPQIRKGRTMNLKLFTASRNLDDIEVAAEDALIVNAGPFRVIVRATRYGTPEMHVIDDAEGKTVFEWPRPEVVGDTPEQIADWLNAKLDSLLVASQAPLTYESRQTLVLKAKALVAELATLAGANR